MTNGPALVRHAGTRLLHARTDLVTARPLRLRLLPLLLAAVVLAAPPWVRAADDPVVLNFVNAEIEAVVKAVAEITGRNFVLDPKVKGVVNIVSARAVPRSLVYPTLLSALRLQGYAAVEAGGITKIVPEADAKQHGSSVAVGNAPVSSGDRLVTQVFSLRYESAAQMVNVLRPLITPNNTVAAFPASNALVVTDYADNLRRIARIVESLDQPPSAEPVILPLRHASALDVAQTVIKLLVEAPASAGQPGPAAEPSQRSTVLADPRSNSLIVRADSPARLGRIRSLVEQLDTPARAGANIRIVYLRNAEAVKVAQTLRAVLTGGATAAQGLVPASGGSLAGAGLTPVAAAGAASGATGVAGTVATLTGLGSGAGAAATGDSQVPGPIVFGGATIQADPTNNALVISAPEPIYNNLRDVIERLDVRRAQVYVEALIAEVTAERAAEFGVQWQFLDSASLDPNYSGSGRGAGGTNFGTRGTGVNIFDAMSNLSSVGQGLNLGVIKGQVTIPGIGAVLNLSVLVRALEADANANILSMPNLITLDNEPAQVVIGQNIPIVTGSYAQGGANPGAVNPFQTFERRDVGLTLRVKPQITEGGSVKMQIYQEVSSVSDPRTLLTPGGVITNKRALESTVLVDDGQIIVLGGLLQDSLTDGGDKVPVLGDLPVVGPLFRYDTRKRAKTNLMVFLRPVVIRNTATSQAITLDRYDYVLGEQRRSVPEPRVFWADPTAPVLPPPQSTGPAVPLPPLPQSTPPGVPPPPVVRSAPGSPPPPPPVVPATPSAAPGLPPPPPPAVPPRQ
jgi:general secretion pathway protein D